MLIVSLVALGSDDTGSGDWWLFGGDLVDPQPNDLEPTSVAFYGYDGQIILGVRNARTEELIVEIGDRSGIVAIYNEAGADILHRPLDGWWPILLWVTFIAGLAIGGL